MNTWHYCYFKQQQSFFSFPSLQFCFSSVWLIMDRTIMASSFFSNRAFLHFCFTCSFGLCLLAKVTHSWSGRWNWVTSAGATVRPSRPFTVCLIYMYNLEKLKKKNKLTCDVITLFTLQRQGSDFYPCDCGGDGLVNCDIRVLGSSKKVIRSIT